MEPRRLASNSSTIMSFVTSLLHQKVCLGGRLKKLQHDKTEGRPDHVSDGVNSTCQASLNGNLWANAKADWKSVESGVQASRWSVS